MTTLFAALNVLGDIHIGQDMQNHHHQEFIRFLNRIEHGVLADKDTKGDWQRLFTEFCSSAYPARGGASTGHLLAGMPLWFVQERV